MDPFVEIIDSILEENKAPAPPKELVADAIGRRRLVTASRNALNGYQKGTCFYCNRSISIKAGATDMAEVDRFLLHALKPLIRRLPVDGVWNLVLACGGCTGEKSARVPALRYLERLHARNEFLIGSHHPLRETIMIQTGPTEEYRRAFLERSDQAAKEMLIRTWHPEIVTPPTF